MFIVNTILIVVFISNINGERKTMRIKLHKEFKYCTPSQIAECSNNCPRDLYLMLWNKGVPLQEEQQQKFAERCGHPNISEWKQMGNTWVDLIQEVNISKIWSKFTDEEKIQIMNFAKIVDWS